MKTIKISSEREKNYALSLIQQMPADGSDTVIIKKTDNSSTADQRRLQWLWYSELGASGIGSADTKESVHIESKWRFARPIYLRDDEVFGIIYEKFMDTVRDSVNYSLYCFHLLYFLCKEHLFAGNGLNLFFYIFRAIVR